VGVKPFDALAFDAAAFDLDQVAEGPAFDGAFDLGAFDAMGQVQQQGPTTNYNRPRRSGGRSGRGGR
jgi:hypothetical protein